jgi:hypothetical protein
VEAHRIAVSGLEEQIDLAVVGAIDTTELNRLVEIHFGEPPGKRFEILEPKDLAKTVDGPERRIEDFFGLVLEFEFDLGKLICGQIRPSLVALRREYEAFQQDWTGSSVA